MIVTYFHGKGRYGSGRVSKREERKINRSKNDNKRRLWEKCVGQGKVFQEGKLLFPND